jgi:hypothetical protein
MPQWPWQRRNRKHIDASGPHAFEPTSDAGLSSGASHAGSRGGLGGNLGEAILTSNFQRDQAHCGVPGCGRERSDPIHDPARR